MELIDLTGLKFGMLEVIKREENSMSGARRWLCRCDCGSLKIIQGSVLKSGHTKSCGCLNRKLASNRQKKHMMTGTKLYNTWQKMRYRCTKEYNIDFKRYGGRGITVCDEWNNSFEAFRDWAMANGYRDDLTLDRIDNNGNYEPSNCRWATTKMQSNNRRTNHFITIGEETRTLAEWSEISGIPKSTILNRIYAGDKENELLRRRRKKQ